MAAAVLLGLPASASAQAPVFAVNTTVDGDDGACTTAAGGCTLREAATRTPTDAVIQLPAGTYTLDRGPLTLAGTRQLEGAGARTTTVTADFQSRVVDVPAGAVTAITAVTVADGDAAEGAGIRVAADAELQVVESIVQRNVAGTGGGIYSEGTLTVRRSTIADNNATTRGGGLAIVDGSALLLASTVSGNFSDETGGGLYTSADVTLASVTIAQNGAFAGLSPSSGGGIQQDFQAGGGDLTSATGTLVVQNIGGNCMGTGDFQIDASDSMADDQLCNVPQEPADNNLPIPPDDELLPLADNGGPTPTHALPEGHPAIDHARQACTEADQRLHPTPQAPPCDAGAYEAQFAFDVTTPEDDDGLCTTAPAGCSLREALTFAGFGAHIVVPPDEYRLTRDLVVNGSVTLDGEDARSTTLVGSGAHRVLTVTGTATVSNVRITGGQATEAEVGPWGGGILVDIDAELELDHSTVDGNRAEFGGGIMNFGELTVTTSTIAGNEAGGDVFLGGGGGLFVLAPTELVNTTISGNRSSNGGGGIAQFGGELEMTHVTLADNASTFNAVGSALLHVAESDGDGGEFGETRAANTLIGGNAGVACAGNTDRPVWDNIVSDDGSCYVAEPASSVGLTELGNHSGPTDTHALLAGSPAINSGDSSVCDGLDVDQRDFVRPLGGQCDVGAFEGDGLASAALRVVTTVVNDGGGTAGPADVNVSVLSGGQDVLGSPRPGAATGRRYLLPPGTYSVAGAAGGYTTAVGGDCAAADGSIALAESDTRECTVTFNDTASTPPSNGGGGGGGSTQPPQQSQPQQEEPPLPPPEAGEDVNALPKSGTVRVKIAGTNRYVELEEGEQIPVGSVVDTTKGRVTIVAAGGQRADFFDGIFRLTQGKGAKPLTTLTLVEPLSCPKAGKAIASAKKKKRRLWGDGDGKFRTKGKHSAATVVGTKWLVEDRCTSTLTRVTKGRVSVRDFVKKKTVVVRAGKKYVARARR